MNYYEHHIKDYDTATQHLSWDEDLAYTRLLRWYYRKERPIPADLAEACRQVRATSRTQKEAVGAVLREFFVLKEDGWHKDECDNALAKFHAGEPERAAKKVNEDTRLARHRAERAELFALINAAGQHLPYNCPIADVRALADRIKRAELETPAATPAETKPATPETAPATPATATHYPVPTPQYPLPNMKGGEGELPAAPPPAPTPAPTPAPPPEPAKPKPLRRCPADFEVTSGMVTWLGANCPLLAQDTALLERENGRFRDCEFKVGKTDWKAAWRNWMADKETKLEERLRIDRRRDLGQQETAGHRQAREAAEVLTGGRVSARKPGDGPPPGHPATLPFIDEEPRHVPPRTAPRLLR